MSTDLLITLGIIGVAALILHLKSHVKFIAIGGFIGLVLAETVGASLQGQLAERLTFFNSTDSTSWLQLALFLVPAVLLGLNHTVDKRRLGFGRTIMTVVATTLFLLANIMAFLPSDLADELVERSTIALQLQTYRVWLIVLMAIVIVIDSFYHKKALDKDKKKKKK